MNGTVGSYEVRTFLAGDVDGNRSVTTADGKAILNLIQTGKYQIEADANLDHAISSIDYVQWRLNIGDQTSLNPMPLSEEIVAPTVSLPGGVIATSQDNLTVNGTTAPGATVSLDTGDGLFDGGTTIADSSGNYSFDVTLPDGLDTLSVKAQTTDPDFAQQRITSAQILVDTQGPNVIFSSPGSGIITNTNITIRGSVSDNGSGISASTMQASVDGGPPVPVAIDAATGDFKFPTDFKLDGSADGPHFVDFTVSDRLGNTTTAMFHLSLETLPLSEEISANTITLPNGILATAQNNFTVSGMTDPGLPVSLEIDYSTPDGPASIMLSTTSDGTTGDYAFPLTSADLPDGLDTLTVTTQTAPPAPSEHGMASTSILVDTQAPILTVSAPANGTVTNIDITIQGTAIDAGSGLPTAGIEASVDGGTPVAVSVNPATSTFQFPTTFLLDHTADGSHTVQFLASDLVGNATATSFTFTLDTTAPTLSITAPQEGATLDASSMLTGTVDGTGSAVSMVMYAFDGGLGMPVTVTNGAFDTSLPLGGLSPGGHTLSVTATDAAGNTTSQALDVTIAGGPTFTMTKYTPLANSQDVGLTVHPEIFFSEPVDPSTVNADDFYATFAGQKLDANILVSGDGTFAWLFFTSPMPDSSDIRITVDGSQIHPQGAPTTDLDAMGNGMAGSMATFDFYTVSAVTVQSAILSGTIADPGPDLQPMTADDYDAATGTPLLPIAGVHIYVVGDEADGVYTNASGHYTLSVPIGDVKIGIDGTTATNPPAGYYFPQMVMDTTMQPGNNTIMPMMSINWLPRVQSAILQTVTNTDTTATMITAGAAGGTGLTPEQQSELSVDVMPGSLIGANGLPVTSAQIGISVVPPSLVMDMLPPGVLQHSFDITVQGLGVTNFSTPAPMTFPNMFNDPTQSDYAAPGSKLYFLSFDHTTGRLVIEGTATVSADGKQVVTDPGTGVTHPGWHGLVPPGAMGNGPGPTPPPCLSTSQLVETVINIGDQIAQCALGLAGFSGAINNILSLINNVQRSYDGAISVINSFKSGGQTCAQITSSLKEINNVKQAALNVASLLSTSNPASPLSKAQAIANCISNLLNSLNYICGQVTSRNSSWNTVITRTVCLGIDLARTEYNKVLALINNANNGLAQLGLAFICQTVNQIATLAGDACKLNPSPSLSGGAAPQVASSDAVVAALEATPMSGDMPPDFTADQQQQYLDLMNQLVGQLQNFNANLQPSVDLLNTTADLGNASMALNGGITQMAYQSLGAANAFYLFEYQDASGNTVDLRGRADANGQVDVVLPPNTPFTFELYDFKQDRIASYQGTTGASGTPTQIPYLTFNPTTPVYDVLGNLVTPGLPHNNGDPLADEVEMIVGISTIGTTAEERAYEDTQVEQGIDPSDVPPPVGIVGTVMPQGDNSDVEDVVANSTDAYLAAGAGGVQVVDITNVSKPVVIASIPASTLGGNAQAVSFTSIPATGPNALPTELDNLVAAALGDNGLAVIDVTDPPAAQLVTTIPIPGGALSVQIVDNLAYVGGHGGLVSVVDMVTDQVVTTFSAVGNGDVTAVKFSGTTLYTLCGGTLAAYDLTSNLGAPTLLSSIVNTGASKMFVGATTAYLTGTVTFLAVDISNPADIQLVSGTFPRQNYSGVAVDGSGSLVVGSANGFNVAYVASLFDITDPTDLNSFVTQFNVPGSVEGVWIQNGLALLADGSGGLAIFNYQQTKPSTNTPTITITTTSPDGQTVTSGSRLEVTVEATDSDNQIRTVTLTANTPMGIVTQTSGSYPFTFFVDVPVLGQGDVTESLNVTVTDTDGNSSSQKLDLAIVPDTTPPKLNSILPVDGHIQFGAVQSFRATFSKPLDTSTLTTGADLSTGSIHIIEAGPDGLFSDGTIIPIGSINFRDSINLLSVIPASPLGPGKYELVLDESMITDRPGNALGSGLFTSEVTVESIPFDAKISGTIASPGQVDLYSFVAPASGELTLFAEWDPDYAGLNDGLIQLIGPDGVTVLGVDQGYGSSELSNILLPSAGVYTVEILAGSGNTLDVGDYYFTISDPDPAPQAIAYGQTASSEIAVRGDHPLWQFQGTAGDLVDLSYDGPSMAGITLENPDGTVAATLPGGTSGVIYALPVTQTGTYSFVIHGGDDTGRYTLQLDEGSFTTTTAGLFDKVQSGTLSRPYSIAEYSYTLHAGDVTTIFADLSGMGGGTVHLLSASTGMDLVPSETGYQAEFSRFQSSVGQTVLVEVLGAIGSSFNTGGFTLTASNPVQPTHTLALGSEQTGTILVRGDDQIWQFTATAGQVVTFGYRGPSLTSGITITAPDGSTLVSLPGGGAIVGRDLVLTQTGTYQFTLSDPDATGGYTLDSSNPAYATKTPVVLTANTPTNGTISPVFDIEWYSFAATSGVPLGVVGEWLPGGSGLGNGEIDVFAPGGALVASASGHLASSVAVPTPVTGTYTIEVRAASGDDFQTGAFRITAWAGAKSPTQDTLATAVDTSIAAGTPTQYQTTGYIGDDIYGVNDVDLYSLQAARGDQIAVSAAATAGSDLGAYIRLFDSSGNELASNATFGGGSGSFLSYTALAAGTYYVGVSSRQNPSYDPNTAGTGSSGEVGGYQLVIDTTRDYTGPTILSVSPTGTSTRSDVSSFTITFNKRLLAVTANDADNYQLVSAGADGVFGTGDDSTIAVTPSYDDSSQTVTLTLASALPQGFSYQLTIKGTGGMPITDIAGNPLNNGADTVKYLQLVSSSSVATPAGFPFNDGFESGSFGPAWTTTTTADAQVVVTNQNSPHSGSYQVEMSDSGGQGRATMILSLDLSSLSAATSVDLSFWHRGYGYYSMPASFSGAVNADGVAISEDGVNWIRVTDLGESTDGSYTHYVADLKGALLAARLAFPPSAPLEIMFQQYLFDGETAYFDDVQVASNLAGPTITSVSTPGPLVFSSGLTAITIDFSNPLQDLGANAASSYELTNQNGTPITVAPKYDDATQETTLTIASPLPGGTYTLRINGNPSVSGTTQIRDTNGNLLNNGVDSVYTFTLISLEASTNDELDTATNTGLVSGGPQYSITTAIGNNSFGPRDVDLYMFTVKAGDRLTASTYSQGYGAAGLPTYLRLFDADGNQLAADAQASPYTTDSALSGFEIPAAGTYYIGASSSRNDEYNPQFSPSGVVGPEGEYTLSIPLVPDTTPPTVTSILPHTGPNVSQVIKTVKITFSEPIIASQATDPSNYSLTYLGPDGILGTPDDQDFTFTPTYSAATDQVTLTLTGPSALVPLPIGSYQLVIMGTSGHITDLAGNPLGGGVNDVEDFNVIPPENPLNDRIADAYDTGIAADGGTYQAEAAIGDNAFGALDVDFYKVQVIGGLQLSATINDSSIGSPLQAMIRLFDAAGNALDAVGAASDATLTYDITTDGTYYIGISGYNNYSYDPFVPGSGNPSSTEGEYILTVTTKDVVPPTVTSISTPQVSVDPTLDQIVIQFSKGMDVSSASAASNYALISSGPDRIFGDADDAAIPFSVAYDATTHQATLTTTGPIPNGDVEVIARGGLIDRGGLALNGGVDQTFEFSQVTSGAAPPFFDGFESGQFGPNWISLQADSRAIAQVTNAVTPRRGTYDLLLASNTYVYYYYYAPVTATAILAVQTTSGSPLELSFYEERTDTPGEYSYQLPATFTGNTPGDGVAISTDGQHWYRVVDLTTQTDTNVYDHFTADLAAAAAADGLSRVRSQKAVILIQP